MFSIEKRHNFNKHLHFVICTEYKLIIDFFILRIEQNTCLFNIKLFYSFTFGIFLFYLLNRTRL